MENAWTKQGIQETPKEGGESALNGSEQTPMMMDLKNSFRDSSASFII